MAHNAVPVWESDQCQLIFSRHVIQSLTADCHNNILINKLAIILD